MLLQHFSRHVQRQVIGVNLGRGGRREGGGGRREGREGEGEGEGEGERDKSSVCLGSDHSLILMTNTHTVSRTTSIVKRLNDRGHTHHSPNELITGGHTHNVLNILMTGGILTTPLIH